MGELAKVAVSLRISGEGLDPDVVALGLGRKPDRSYRQGDMMSISGGQECHAKVGSCSWSISQHEPGTLEVKIERLLAMLTHDLEIWRRTTTSWKADIFCGLFLNSLNEGAEISSSTLQALGDRGLLIGFDIYSAPSDASEPQVS